MPLHNPANSLVGIPTDQLVLKLLQLAGRVEKLEKQEKAEVGGSIKTAVSASESSIIISPKDVAEEERISLSAELATEDTPDFPRLSHATPTSPSTR
jgi:hypothetical protein